MPCQFRVCSHKLGKCLGPNLAFYECLFKRYRTFPFSLNTYHKKPLPTLRNKPRRIKNKGIHLKAST